MGYSAGKQRRRPAAETSTGAGRLYVSLETGREHRAKQRGRLSVANFPQHVVLYLKARRVERRSSRYDAGRVPGLLRSRGRHDVDLRFELAVVSEVTHEFQIESLEYKNSSVRDDFTVIREPGLVVHLALPDL